MVKGPYFWLNIMVKNLLGAILVKIQFIYSKKRKRTYN